MAVDFRFQPVLTETGLHTFVYGRPSAGNPQADYRITSISAYGPPDSPVYSVVMTYAPEQPVQHVHSNLTSDQLTSTDITEAVASYHIRRLTATIDGSGTTRFTGVWERSTSEPILGVDLDQDALADLCTRARWNLDPTDPTKNQARDPSFEPSSLAVYGEPGNRRYAIVLIENPRAVAWNAGGSDDSPDGYEERKRIQYNDRGKRPFLLSPTADGNLASAFRDDLVPEWHSVTGIPAAQITGLVDSYREKHYYPLDIQAAGIGEDAQFAAIFVRSATITPRVRHVTLHAGQQDDYDNAVFSVMQRFGARQAALALVKGTKLVLARGYTYAEVDYPIVQPWTLFRVASCSKTVTAIMIHQLINENLLNLDETLVDVLKLEPPIGASWGDERFKDITIQHLLDHTSGVPVSFDDPTVVKAFPGAVLPITPRQMASWLTTQPLTGKPGSFAAWGYNNVGYDLLGQVVAGRRRTTFFGAVEQHVLGPLRMHTTRMAVEPRGAQPPDEALYVESTMGLYPSVMDPAQPLVPSGYGNANFGVSAGGGGLSASVIDLARVLAALSITTTDNPLLDPGEIQKMFQASARTTDQLPGFAQAQQASKDQLQPQAMRAHGWDGCNNDPPDNPMSWYAQKGGNYAGAGACIRFRMDGVHMAFAIARQPIGTFEFTYPDFPVVTQLAESTDWGDTDLFPMFEMPPLPS